MPELPEVETIVRSLAGPLTGRMISRINLIRRDILRAGTARRLAGLVGCQIERIVREGKRIRFELRSGTALVFHLGMTGRLSLQPVGATIEKHTHLTLGVKGLSEEMRFRDPRRFGGIWLLSGGQAGPSLKQLGPDALNIRVPVLRDITRRSRQIKALLMDQYAISGLGNIYCDEALFRAGIHPLSKASRLTDKQVRNLACSIRKVLQASLDSGGSTLRDYRKPDGSEGAFQQLHEVYGREGEACLRCKSSIQRRQIAGRSTHYCPNCQGRAFESRRSQGPLS